MKIYWERFHKEHRNLVENLLHNFKDIFASNTLKPGVTSLVEHTIDTGNSKPINQAPYRVGFHERKTIETEINQMLENGIIEPSKSPWASSVM